MIYAVRYTPKGTSAVYLLALDQGLSRKGSHETWLSTGFDEAVRTALFLYAPSWDEGAIERQEAA